MTSSLRQYQCDAINSIRDAFAAGHRRVLFTLPTGGGKTWIFCWIAAQMAQVGKRICILVHRDELLAQVSRSLCEFGVQHGTIAAGSKATSDSVQVASVFTLARRVKSQSAAFFKQYKFDLIIADEAHHAVAGSWAQVCEAFPMAKVLGVTATPCRLDGKGLAGAFDVLVVGPSVESLTAEGFLVPSVIYAPPGGGVDLSAVHTRAGDYAKNELADILDRPAIYGSAVEHYMKLCPGVPAVAFCVSVKHAEHTAEQFRAAGIRSESIDGAMHPVERARRVKGLADGSVQVLTSCDLISEGFDCPAITAAILLRPTKSESLYMQQVGRSLRPFPGKTEAIILDHVGNVMRHGLPEDDREWVLTVDQAHKKSERVIGVRQCLKCYAIAGGRAIVCPRCGAEFPVRGRSELETVGGELKRLTKKDIRAAERAAEEQRRLEARERVGKLITPETRESLIRGAQTLKEMNRVAKMLGYDHKWAWGQYTYGPGSRERLRAGSGKRA